MFDSRNRFLYIGFGPSIQLFAFYDPILRIDYGIDENVLLDEQENQLDDNTSIGIILCPIKDNLEVEYALRTSTKPMGV